MTTAELVVVVWGRRFSSEVRVRSLPTVPMLRYPEACGSVLVAVTVRKTP